MSTIAPKLVIVAGTGVGKTFTAYNATGNLATFREDSPVAAAGFLTLKRIEPKPTKDYPGAMKGEVKLTRQSADLTGRLWPAIVTVSSSLPAFLTDAQRVAIITEGLLCALEQVSQDALSKLLVPQS